MASKHHKNTLLRIQHVCAITQQYYEEGNAAKCYKAVWRRYVYPVYPMCYRTYLKYINTPLGDLHEPPDNRQLNLF